MILTAFKSEAPLYAGGVVLTNNQQNRKENTSMTSFSKTAYWGPLSPNFEGLDNTTNPHFKHPCDPPVAEKEAEFVLLKRKFSI